MADPKLGINEFHAAQKRERCWICGCLFTSRFRPSTIRRSVGPETIRITDSNYGETSALRKCRRCSFIFADELPHPDLVGLYRSMTDPEYASTARARREQMRQLLDLAMSYHPHGRSLLDVGAGIGLLTTEALARGLRSDGVEPSRWCVETAAKTNRVSLLCGTLEECRDRLGEYDLVMMVDVIEHTVEPLRLIQEGASRLAPGGLLFIVTPDISSPLARLMGRWWWHHRVGHVCYFTRGAMHRALEESGLELVAEPYVGWRFPVTYLFARLQHYMPFPPFSTILRWLTTRGYLSRYEVNLNLRDSRMFIAKNRREK